LNFEAPTPNIPGSSVRGHHLCPEFGQGTTGWELLRRRPEWFYASPQGIPASWGVDAWDLAHWNDFRHTDVATVPFAYDTLCVFPDLRQPAALEWGIKELIASVKDFGWDGVRFDGHWTAGNDADNSEST